MSDDAPRLLYEPEDGVAVVTLNRPEKRNALDARTVEELKRALGDAAADDAVRVVLLRGAGPDFCSGADLSELEKIARAAGPIENLTDASALGELFVAMRRHPKPIVAVVHGHAFAGGAGLATACDLVVAAENAVFGYPEVRLGFVPAMVMAILRRATSEKVAFELAARGDRVSAADAQRFGLVNRLRPAATLHADALEYARELASRPAEALLLIKRLLYGMDGMAFEEAIARGAEVNALARATEDCQAGVRAFLESRRR